MRTGKKPLTAFPRPIKYGKDAVPTSTKVVDKCNEYLEGTRSSVTKFISLEDNIMTLEASIEGHRQQLVKQEKGLRYLKAVKEHKEKKK